MSCIIFSYGDSNATLHYKIPDVQSVKKERYLTYKIICTFLCELH